MKYNGCGLRFQLLELEDLLSEHDIEFACITETFLTSTKIIFVPGFSTYRHDRVSDRGATVILVRFYINHFQCPIFIVGRRRH